MGPPCFPDTQLITFVAFCEGSDSHRITTTYNKQLVFVREGELERRRESRLPVDAADPAKALQRCIFWAMASGDRIADGR